MDLMNFNHVAKLLCESKKCLVGVSGGIDSMVMLHWINSHRSKISADITVMYVNHDIHPNSHEWGQLVKTTCEEYNLPFVNVKVNLSGLGNNLEYAARKARYKAFCEFGADTLILAHHANDQFECFLLKLFRGSGLKGLKAMSQSTKCWYDEKTTLIRPMLDVTKYKIHAYAEYYNLKYVDDPSNGDSKYDRNYIRNHLMPVISQRFEIADVNAVRSIQHVSEAWELTQQLADIDLQSCTTTDGHLDWEKMKNLGYLRIKNVILRILDMENAYGFSIGHIEQFSLGIMNASMDSKTELGLKNMSIQKIGKKIKIIKRVELAA